MHTYPDNLEQYLKHRDHFQIIANRYCTIPSFDVSGLSKNYLRIRRKFKPPVDLPHFVKASYRAY